MRTYYFDLKDGVPTRDRRGIEFSTAGGAIDHSKELARRLRNEPRLDDPDLVIIVIDESGAEIHREPVHSGESRPGVLFGNTGLTSHLEPQSGRCHRPLVSVR